MTHYCIFIAAPLSWNEGQVRMLAERLIAESLPESVHVALVRAENMKVRRDGAEILQRGAVT